MPGHAFDIRKAGHSGKAGELAVVDVVACPNCRSRLMQLPPGFPLFDVQCTRCMFRAQVKTVRSGPPKDQIFGAGWDVLEKTLKTGQLIPPLLLNFQWADGATRTRRQEVYFFPFLTKDNVRRRQRSEGGQRPGYREFNYVGLLTLPHMRLFPPSLNAETSKTTARRWRLGKSRGIRREQVRAAGAVARRWSS
jgi:hypothetical protein